MTTQFVPLDQNQRDRITSGLDETLFVEAGAGTGKTEALVSRIVALITTGRATINGVAAITFTELAAAELRERGPGGPDSAAGAVDRTVRPPPVRRTGNRASLVGRGGPRPGLLRRLLGHPEPVRFRIGGARGRPGQRRAGH